MSYPSFAEKYGQGESPGAGTAPEMPVPLGAAGGPNPAPAQENPWSKQKDQRLDPWLPDEQNAQVAMNPAAKV